MVGDFFFFFFGEGLGGDFWGLSRGGSKFFCKAAVDVRSVTDARRIASVSGRFISVSRDRSKPPPPFEMPPEVKKKKKKKKAKKAAPKDEP